MQSVLTYIKDPEAILDYGFDWHEWLGEDTIIDSTWTVPTGITKVSSTYSATFTIIWLSGGTANTSYSVINHIKTAGGREDDRTINIRVVPR